MNEMLPALERLGQEIERVARAAGDGRRTVQPRRGGGRRLPRRAAIIAIVTFVVVAAAAVAATTGLLTGEPVSNPKGVGFTPKRGLGAPVAGTIKVLAVRVADPDGGPPWGLRTFRSTRGLTCVQLGRVQQGRLGVLGQDGAFSDDGRFHEWPSSVVGQTFCQERDGAGHAFMALGLHGLPASGLTGACVVSAASPPLPSCPRQDLRVAYYGLLGPQATAVTYRDDTGRAATAPTAGPDGAYLVVRRPDRRHPAQGWLSVGVSPGSALLSVHYRDAPACRIGNPRRIGGARGCPLVGFRPAAGATITATEVRTPVHASLAAHATPVPVPMPAAARRAGAPAKLRRLTITFRARVAARGAATSYVAAVELGRSERCEHNRTTVTTGSDHDIAAGEIVTLRADLPAGCVGPVRGFVAFHQQRGKPSPSPGMDVPWLDVRVGDFDARVRG
jgi:hypothetical protein